MTDLAPADLVAAAAVFAAYRAYILLGWLAWRDVEPWNWRLLVSVWAYVDWLLQAKQDARTRHPAGRAGIGRRR